MLIRQLNGLGVIPPVAEPTIQFHSRPYKIAPAEDIAVALRAALAGSPLAALPPFVGGIDLIADATDAVKSAPFLAALRSMYREALRCSGS